MRGLLRLTALVAVAVFVGSAHASALRTDYVLHFKDQYGRALCARGTLSEQTPYGTLTHSWPSNNDASECAPDNYLFGISVGQTPGHPEYAQRPLAWKDARQLAGTAFECSSPSPASSDVSDTDGQRHEITIVFQCTTAPPVSPPTTTTPQAPPAVGFRDLFKVRSGKVHAITVGDDVSTLTVTAHWKSATTAVTLSILGVDGAVVTHTATSATFRLTDPPAGKHTLRILATKVGKPTVVVTRVAQS